jgi:putative PIN family toxin of toxin-antitoxin system
MRLVVDTDVLVAGLRSHSGASRILLQAVEAGVIQPLISVATALEYEAVLTRAEQLDAMQLTHANVSIFLDRFLATSEEVSPYYNHGGVVRDPNDDKFVTAAINGNAEAIVTFNIRDYVPRDGRVTGLGITVCRPGDILRRLSWRPSVTLPFGYLPH